MMVAPTPGGTAMTVNGLSFHVVDEGSGPPVLLLHGFPDSAALWRHQIPALVDAGHRVIAPDLRGFGASDRPEGVGEYAITTILGDVVGILDALGVERTAVVGHDWGASIGWALSGLHPERVTRYAALSVGHPGGYFTDLRQREMSWNMLLFLHNGAEEWLRRDDWALLRAWMRNPVDIERYLADLGRPGALTAALSYYRANIPAESLTGRPARTLPAVACPVLAVWSDGDFGCGEAQMLASEQTVTGPWRYHRITGAGHWIPLDAPDELSTLLVEFLR
jgi:pimeloyl-ACP methyl ester carboxylesterase